MTGETNRPPRVFVLTSAGGGRENEVDTEIEISGIIEEKSVLVPQVVAGQTIHTDPRHHVLL